MTRRSSEAGLTLIELMVAMGLAAIATAFAFGIYAKTSQAYRNQHRVAEVQQTLRSASEIIVRDTRQAGYRISELYTAAPSLVGALGALSVDNNAEADGSDVITVVYSDESAGVARVSTTGPAFQAAVTRVDQPGGLQEGDIAVAIRTADPGKGQACTLKITKVQPVAGGSSYMLQHTPSNANRPWNQPGNSQCENLPAWNDGNTIFTRLYVRSYRIKPNDPGGILQMSPSGGLVADDWVDLVVGIVDLQAAMRVFQPGDVVDEDLDGDPERDWFSGDNMETILDTAGNELLEVRVSLVARSTAEVADIVIDRSPDLYNPAMSLQHNDVGDHPGVDIASVTDMASRYYGKRIFRWSSTVVDIRNMGVGR